MTNTKIVIRLASQDDIESLSGLMTELGYPTTKEEMRERFRIIDKEPGYKIFIAEIDTKVVGMAGALKCYYFEEAGHYVRLAALVTREAYRQKGVGRALVNAVELWCRAINATSLILNCGNREERQAAHLFYRQLGFQVKSTGYIKKLELIK